MLNLPGTRYYCTVPGTRYCAVYHGTSTSTVATRYVLPGRYVPGTMVLVPGMYYSMYCISMCDAILTRHFGYLSVL
jgi:hypothetical protein